MDSKRNVPIGEVKYRVSTKEKKKNKFFRQTKIIDSLCDSAVGKVDGKEYEKYKINYDLLNGRLNNELYDAEEFCSINGEKVLLDAGEIPHNPMISLYCKILMGEFMQRPFDLTVEETSLYKNTVGKEEYIAKLKKYIEDGIIIPARRSIEQQLFAESGITDPYSLDQDQQMQVQAEVMERLQDFVSKGLTGFLEGDFNSPMSVQAQEIAEYSKKKYNLQNKYTEGFIHSIPTNSSYYYVNVGEKGVEFEFVTPTELNYGGPDFVEDVEKNDWAVRKIAVTVPYLTQKFANSLRQKHWALLEKNYVSNVMDSSRDVQEGRYQVEIVENGEEIVRVFGSQDSTKRENFANIAAAYDYVSGLGGGLNTSAGIPLYHCTWRDKRKLYKVYRNVDGKVKRFYFAEHYRKRESDLECVELWVDEIWEGYRIGDMDPIYVGIQPLPYQWKSLEDPFTVELPYVGKQFNTYRGLSRNVSMIDLAKQYNRDYDTQMAALRRDLRTNMGKVFLMHLDGKPDNLTWTEFFRIAKDFNVMLLNNKKKGINALDMQYAKSVDMSKMNDIVNRLSLINDILQKLQNVMGFNQIRAAGQVSQYANTANIVAQQQGAYNQTEYLFETHRQVFERAINKLINISRLYYKDNPEELKFVLTPTSYMELEKGLPFWYSHFDIYLENSGRAARELEALKAQSHAFIQNSVNPIDVINLNMVKSKSDLIKLVRDISKRNAEAQQQAHQARMAEIQAQEDGKMDREQAKIDANLQMKRDTLESQEARALISSEIFRKANDVDDNKKSDLLQAKELEMAAKERMNDKKLETQILLADK